MILSGRISKFAVNFVACNRPIVLYAIPIIAGSLLPVKTDPGLSARSPVNIRNVVTLTVRLVFTIVSLLGLGYDAGARRGLDFS